MKDIAIYGAGGFGREIFCLLKRINEEIVQLSGFLPFQLKEWDRIGQIILDVGISSTREAVN